MKEEKEINLENEFKLYLQRAGFKEERRLPQYQYDEMKRAFYGGIGQLLIVLRDDVGSKYSQQAVVFDNLLNQVASFWLNHMKEPLGKQVPVNNAKQIDGRRMAEVAQIIQHQIPGLGFTLLTYEFGEEKTAANYVSNSNREDTVRFLRETADRLDNGKDYPIPNNN